MRFEDVPPELRQHLFTLITVCPMCEGGKAPPRLAVPGPCPGCKGEGGFVHPCKSTGELQTRVAAIVGLAGAR